MITKTFFESAPLVFTALPNYDDRYKGHAIVEMEGADSEPVGWRAGITATLSGNVRVSNLTDQSIRIGFGCEARVFFAWRIDGKPMGSQGGGPWTDQSQIVLGPWAEMEAAVELQASGRMAISNPRGRASIPRVPWTGDGGWAMAYPRAWARGGPLDPESLDFAWLAEPTGWLAVFAEFDYE